MLDDPSLLELAVTHRSYVAEHGGAVSNERLEFLGDAVLGLVVADEIFRGHPGLPEGDLARIRAAVVSTEALAPVAAALGVGPALRLGRGEELSGGRAKDSILADTLEALIAACYLDGGLVAARRVVLRLLGRQIAEHAVAPGANDWKNRLQELAAERSLERPVYTLAEHGPDHERQFTAEVCIGTDLLGFGTGTSKKRAEQAAARAALARLAVRDEPTAGA